MSIFEGVGLEGLGLEGLGLEAFGLEWWAMVALLFILPKIFVLLLALLFMFAEKIPGFETFAGGRVKAFKEHINQQLLANAQKIIQLFRPSKS